VGKEPKKHRGNEHVSELVYLAISSFVGHPMKRREKIIGFHGKRKVVGGRFQVRRKGLMESGLEDKGKTEKKRGNNLKNEVVRIREVREDWRNERTREVQDEGKPKGAACR